MFADWLEDHGAPLAELIRIQRELPHSSTSTPGRARWARAKELVPPARPGLARGPNAAEVRGALEPRPARRHLRGRRPGVASDDLLGALRQGWVGSLVLDVMRVAGKSAGETHDRDAQGFCRPAYPGRGRSGNRRPPGARPALRGCSPLPASPVRMIWVCRFRSATPKLRGPGAPGQLQQRSAGAAETAEPPPGRSAFAAALAGRREQQGRRRAHRSPGSVPVDRRTGLARGAMALPARPDRPAPPGPPLLRIYRRPARLLPPVRPACKRCCSLPAGRSAAADWKSCRCMPHLRTLDLSQTPVKDDALEPRLLRATGNPVPDLDGTSPTRSAHLPALANLCCLGLPNRIKAAGLQHLRSLKNLETLDLGATRLTREGLSYLAKAAPVTPTECPICALATPAAMTWLQEQRPQLSDLINGGDRNETVS